MKLIHSLLLLSSSPLFWGSSNVVQAQFEEVEISRAPDDDDTAIRGVVLPAICYGAFPDVPQAMYTVRTAPSNDNTVRIFANPPDLIQAGLDVEDGLIYLRFTDVVQDAVAERAFEDAGVVVEFPPDELQVVTACCGQTVQIQNGFTNVRDLIVHSGATVRADFTERLRERLTVDVRDEATLIMDVNTEASGGSAVVTVRRASVEIIGNLRTLDCADNADCVLDGTVTNNGRAIASSTIDANSCENISGNCDDTDPTVTVDTSRSLTMNGQVEVCVQASQLVPEEFVNDGDAPITDDDNLANDDISDDEVVEDDRFTDDRFNDPTPAPTPSPTATRDAAVSLSLTTTVALATVAAAAMLLM